MFRFIIFYHFFCYLVIIVSGLLLEFIGVIGVGFICGFLINLIIFLISQDLGGGGESVVMLKRAYSLREGSFGAQKE